MTTVPPPLPESELALFRLHALQLRGEWSAHDDGAGRLFYFDEASQHSQWETPPAFAGREGELMMALMLQHAVARSGAWTAHDAGHGTLYYFNERTRESVWERPAEWGAPELEARAEAEARTRAAEEERERQLATQRKMKAKEPKPKRKSRAVDAAIAPPARAFETEAEAEEEAVRQDAAEVEEKEPPKTEEERAADERQQAAERKRTEAFRQMLRDKKVMPFTKWSVAMPRIISDPRFVAIPTMDERRAIFEHFVQHRRDDLKAEKKNKLKDAKKAFSALLRGHFAQQLRDGAWDAKTDLSVTLATLEAALDAEQFKSVQENAMALLPTSTQKKLFEKAMADAKETADKHKTEETALVEFLRTELTTTAAASLRDARWENEQLQQLVASFYASRAEDAAAPLLSKELQRRVFRRVQDAIAPARSHRDSKYGGGGRHY
ncbi:hypothetical protein PybrP1_007911 [[Pythium] brassicae (nom. inval.)]|nr:hypothetical protein PybrP1_007911 [[Pythium] brassicae (nom. inval.)]